MKENLPVKGHGILPGRTSAINEPRKATAMQAWILAVVGFLPIMSIVGLAPALPTLVNHFSYMPNAKTMVPLLLTAPGLCVALLSPFAGYLTDKYGRRPFLLAAIMLYSVGGVVPLFIDHFDMIMTGRFVLGIAQAFIFTLANVLLADYYSQAERPKWIALQGIVGPVLGTLLLALTGQLASLGWQWPFIIFVPVFIIFILAFIFLFEPPRIKPSSTEQEAETPVPWRVIGLISIVTLFTSIIYFVYTIHYGLVLDEIGITDSTMVGRLSAVASIGTPIGAFIYKRNSKYIIGRQFLMVSFLLGIGLIGVGLFKDYRLNLVAAFIQQLGCGMTIPMLVGWSLGLLPAQHRGRGMGFWTSCLFIGQFVCPLVVSFAREMAGGFQSAFVVFGLVAIVILLLLLVSLITKKRRVVVSE